MTLYGMPYQGSKSRLAEKIIDLIPSNTTFYDLFAGGCSVTHCALVSNKFNGVICNDYDEFVMNAFEYALHDMYKNVIRFADKTEFDYFRREDPYIACCFSFGNNWRTYAYGRDIEDYKRQYHNAVFYKDIDGLKRYGINLKGINLDIPIEERYVRVQGVIREQSENKDTVHVCLPHFNALRRLWKLSKIPTPIITHLDYRDVNIRPGSVIYCDPPYKFAGGYNYQTFDHEAFYEWCSKQDNLTFISEYQMPDNFIKVAQFTLRTLFGPVSKCMHDVNECLFIPKHQYDLLTDHLKYMVETLNKENKND